MAVTVAFIVLVVRLALRDKRLQFLKHVALDVRVCVLVDCHTGCCVRDEDDDVPALEMIDKSARPRW